MGIFFVIQTKFSFVLCYCSCSHEKYEIEKLPTVSVIICFFNEHIVTLLRSVKTVLERSPSNLLKEIILVDDYSDIDDLGETLQNKIQTMDSNNKIRLLRNTKREGLIRSRVFGARNCTGDVLIFLDSHVETNVGYAEPILNRIRQDRKVLAIPVIDIINADTFAYTSSPLVRGGFNWGLHFKWDSLPAGTLVRDADFLGPFKSPTMAGGLFAIDRLYFKEIGEYDLGYVLKQQFFIFLRLILIKKLFFIFFNVEWMYGVVKI